MFLPVMSAPPTVTSLLSLHFYAPPTFKVIPFSYTFDVPLTS